MSSKQKPLTISIIIPVYNEQNYLLACLEAIAAQSVAPLEVIVVDNNSSDDSVKIAKLFKFVRVIKVAKQGVVYARDAGFDAAKGQLIGRIDADTILPNNWVQKITEFYSDPTHARHAFTGGCYFYNVIWPCFGGWVQSQIAFRLNRFMMGHYILYGSNMALPADMWQAVRAKVCHVTNEHEDLDLAIHLHKLGYEISYQESLKVGVEMRRVFSNRRDLWANLKWWPRTLRSHQRKLWFLAYPSAMFLHALSRLHPLISISKRPNLNKM